MQPDRSTPRVLARAARAMPTARRLHAIAAFGLAACAGLLASGCEATGGGAARRGPAGTAAGAAAIIPIPVWQGPGLFMVHGDMVMLAEHADLAWLAGAPVLESGNIEEQDPACVDDPPDYEAEQSRYWDCHNTAPEHVYDRFVASQAIDPEALPADLAGWTGRRMALYGRAGVLCEATVGAPFAWGEWSTTVAAVSGGGLADGSVAGAVLDARAAVMAPLEGACEGAAFARPVELPPPPQWTLRDPQGSLAVRIERARAALPLFQELEAGARGIGAGVRVSSVELAPPGPGRRFAIALGAGPADCHTDGFAFGLWEITAQGALEFLFDGSERIEVTAAADVTGDGIPEIMLDVGLDVGQLRWQGEEFELVEPLAFPVEPRDACHCECE